MKINKINLIKPSYIFKPKCEPKRQTIAQNVSLPFGKMLSVYDYVTNQVNEKQFSKNFLNRKGKVTSEEAKDIIENHPVTVVEAYKLVEKSSKGALENKKIINQTPKITAKATINLKNYFDKTYKNYRIISIGTSPSSITEAMEHLGIEVVHVPASSLGKLVQHDAPRALGKIKPEELRNVKIILKYIKSKIPKDDNKYNIVLDYVCSGKTLRAFCDLIRNNTKINENKTVKMSLSEALEEAFWEDEQDRYSDDRIENIDRIVHDCVISTSEKISNTPHFDVDDFTNYFRNRDEELDYICSRGKSYSQVIKEFEGFSRPLARAYNLCVYNELNKMGAV